MGYRKAAERYLDRALGNDEVIHHIDGNKKNNDISNLKVMTGREHSSLHNAGRRKQNGKWLSPFRGDKPDYTEKPKRTNTIFFNTQTFFT